MGRLLRLRRRRKRFRSPPVWLLIGGVVAGLGLVALVPSHSKSTAGQAEFWLCGWAHRQNCVIDGDTIRYRGVKIRLADVDAPEISEPKCTSEAALGQRAKHRLLELMNAGPFELIQIGGHDQDGYGRKLRTVMRHGRSLGDTLISEGLGRRWDGARRSWCG